MDIQKIINDGKNKIAFGKYFKEEDTYIMVEECFFTTDGKIDKTITLEKNDNYKFYVTTFGKRKEDKSSFQFSRQSLLYQPLDTFLNEYDCITIDDEEPGLSSHNILRISRKEEEIQISIEPVRNNLTIYSDFFSFSKNWLCYRNGL